MSRQDYRTTRPTRNTLSDPPIFKTFNAAIAHADAEGDDWTVDLLLAAKMAAVRRHHEKLAGR